jgi:hypothetical protein
MLNHLGMIQPVQVFLPLLALHRRLILALHRRLILALHRRLILALHLPQLEEHLLQLEILEDHT